jgi:hypothetical protein
MDSGSGDRKVTAPEAIYDEDGYPTDESLKAIETFVGTPKDLVAFAIELFQGGFVSVADVVDELGRDAKQVTFVTRGWSGAESVIGALSYRTGFHMQFWHSSYRGGQEIYSVPNDRWESETFLAKVRHR